MIIQSVYTTIRGQKHYVANIFVRYDHKVLAAVHTDPNAAHDFVNEQNAKELMGRFVNWDNKVYETESIEIKPN